MAATGHLLDHFQVDVLELEPLVLCTPTCGTARVRTCVPDMGAAGSPIRAMGVLENLLAARALHLEVHMSGEAHHSHSATES